MWTYMYFDPFDSIETFRDWMKAASKSTDPQPYALVEVSTGKAVGMAGYGRIKKAVGVIEIGGLAFSPRLQKTAAATEAMFLMMSRVF